MTVCAAPNRLLNTISSSVLVNVRESGKWGTSLANRSALSPNSRPESCVTGCFAAWMSNRAWKRAEKCVPRLVPKLRHNQPSPHERTFGIYIFGIDVHQGTKNQDMTAWLHTGAWQCWDRGRPEARGFGRHDEHDRVWCHTPYV